MFNKANVFDHTNNALREKQSANKKVAVLIINNTSHTVITFIVNHSAFQYFASMSTISSFAILLLPWGEMYLNFKNRRKNTSNMAGHVYYRAIV